MYEDSDNKLYEDPYEYRRRSPRPPPPTRKPSFQDYTRIPEAEREPMKLQVPANQKIVDVPGLLQQQSNVNGKKDTVQVWLDESIDPNICTCFPKATLRMNPTMIYNDKKACPYHEHMKPEEVYKFTHPWTARGVRNLGNSGQNQVNILKVKHQKRETPMSQLSYHKRSVQSDPNVPNVDKVELDDPVPGTAPGKLGLKPRTPSPEIQTGEVVVDTHSVPVDSRPMVTTPFITQNRPTDQKPFEHDNSLFLDNDDYYSYKHIQHYTRGNDVLRERERHKPLTSPVIKPGKNVMTYSGYDIDEMSNYTANSHGSYTKAMTNHKGTKKLTGKAKIDHQMRRRPLVESPFSNRTRNATEVTYEESDNFTEERSNRWGNKSNTQIDSLVKSPHNRAIAHEPTGSNFKRPSLDDEDPVNHDAREKRVSYSDLEENQPELNRRESIFQPTRKQSIAQSTRKQSIAPARKQSIAQSTRKQSIAQTSKRVSYPDLPDLEEDDFKGGRKYSIATHKTKDSDDKFKRRESKVDPNLRNPRPSIKEPQPKLIVKSSRKYGSDKDRQFMGEYFDINSGEVYKFQVRHSKDAIDGNRTVIP